MGFLQFIPPRWRRTYHHPTPNGEWGQTMPQDRAPHNRIRQGAVRSFPSAPPQTHQASAAPEIPNIDAFGTSPWVGLYYRHEFLLHHRHELLASQGDA
jgi:hypothetical protein